MWNLDKLAKLIDINCNVTWINAANFKVLVHQIKMKIILFWTPGQNSFGINWQRSHKQFKSLGTKVSLKRAGWCMDRLTHLVNLSGVFHRGLKIEEEKRLQWTIFLLNAVCFPLPTSFCTHERHGGATSVHCEKWTLCMCVWALAMNISI